MRTEWFAFEALFLAPLRASNLTQRRRGAKSGPGKQIRLNLFTPGVLRITTELTAWYATDFTIGLAICIALAGYGFYASLAGQPLFGGKLMQLSLCRRVEGRGLITSRGLSR